MVQGLSDFERRWAAVPRRVIAAVEAEMERTADLIVADMNKVKPLPEIFVGWTWGKVPKGALTIGQVESGSENRPAITLYATAKTEEFPQGFGAVASWFEHGTGPRVQKKTGRYTGQIHAQPFFYPVWRIWRRRVKGRITRAINKALKTL